MLLLILICTSFIIQCNYAAELVAGDLCQINDKSYGQCSFTLNCEEIKNNLLKFIVNHTKCSYDFEKHLEIVCCPNSTITIELYNQFHNNTISTTTQQPSHGSLLEKKLQVTRTNYNKFNINDQRISIRKCKEYQLPVTERLPDVRNIFTGRLEPVYRVQCNQSTTPLIHKGHLVKALEFPHMVLIGTTADPNPLGRWYCGGSLISDEFILTAAHCAHRNIGSERQEADRVLLGDLDISKTTDIAQPLILEIIKIYIHQNYSDDSGYDDIALVKLNKKVKFSHFIRPACLSSDINDYNVHITIATGWGATTKILGTNPSRHLKGVNLELIDVQTCQMKLQTLLMQLLLEENIRNTSQICAGSANGEDTCSGDSGGPLQIYHLDHYNFECMYTVIGITSIGYFCGIGYPGVYTRVLHYIDWIENIVWPNN